MPTLAGTVPAVVFSLAWRSEMATAMRSGKAARAKFNQGYGTFHQEEIEVGKALEQAATLIYGKQKLRRMLSADPARVFQPLRYGRRLLHEPDDSLRGFICVMIDRPPYLSGKATNEYILLPGKKGWRKFAENALAIAQLPRWADGLSASAEALDDLGYAVAESIAAMLAFDIESDDQVCLTLRR